MNFSRDNNTIDIPSGRNRVKEWLAMPLDRLRSMVSRRPAWVVGFWFTVAVTVGLLAPDLTRLAAEGQANLLTGEASESLRTALDVGRDWPDQYYESLAIVVLNRPGGLTEADHAYARSLSDRITGPGHPELILRVVGPRSDREIAERLVSRDGTTELMAVHLGKSFVSPATQRAVAWLEA